MHFKNLLSDLAEERPLFHSEADFQHALAWKIHSQFPNANVRLEYRPAAISEKMYIDLWVDQLPDGSKWAIELKYKTRSLKTKVNGESYELLNQSAQDTARYDFLRDVLRLERISSERPEVKGAAILLTNDSGYWSPSRTSDTVDAAFRIHEGRSIEGKLSWGIAASAGTMRARETPISLVAAYSVGWTAYSKIAANTAGEFRYTLLKIKSGHLVSKNGTGKKP